MLISDHFHLYETNSFNLCRTVTRSGTSRTITARHDYMYIVIRNGTHILKMHSTSNIDLSRVPIGLFLSNYHSCAEELQN